MMQSLAGEGMANPSAGSSGADSAASMMEQLMGGGAAAGSESETPRGRRSRKKSAQHTAAKEVQIRFLDFMVHPERTYQYRLRVAIENPNYNRPDVADDTFNKAESLTGEWSEPSPVVYVPADVEYYIVQRRRRGDVKIEVHNWLEQFGDWQISDFHAAPGDVIGRTVRDHQWVDFDEEMRKERVDFFTKNVLIDVTGGAERFVFEGASVTEPIPADILVMNEYGDLVSRNQSVDEHDPSRIDRSDNLRELLDLVRGDTETARIRKKDDKDDNPTKKYDRSPKRRSGRD
jgi:hypothetical protein